MPHSQLRALHDQMVTVLTSTGVPVAVGRLQLIEARSGPWVELNFKTQVVRCSITLLPEEVERLRESYDGEGYRHILPDGDKLWRAELPAVRIEEAAKPTAALEENELVETFPLPPSAKLGALIPEQLSKEGMPPTTINPPPAPNAPKPEARVPLRVEPVKPLQGRQSKLR